MARTRDPHSARSLRGYNPWRSHAILSRLPGSISEGLSLDRYQLDAHSAQVTFPWTGLLYGFYVMTDYFRRVEDGLLVGVARELGFAVAGREDAEQTLDRWARYAPLASPLLEEGKLPLPLSPSLTPRERLLVIEVHSRLDRREQRRTELEVGELAARMGHVDEDLRVTGAAIKRIGEVLAVHGILSRPDLAQSTPARDQKVILESVDVTLSGRGDLADLSVASRGEEANSTRNEQTGTYFLSWVLSRIDSRPMKVETFKLAELVNRLGRYRAARRLRLEAAQDVAEFLADHGLAIEPDPRIAGASPGVDALVHVRRQRTSQVRGEWDAGDPILEYSLRLGMAIAQADGLVDEREIEELRRHAKQRVHTHSPDEHSLITQMIDQLSKEKLDVDRLVDSLAQELDEGERKQVLDYLFDVAVADGIFVPEEEALLRQLQRRLGFDEEHFERLIRLCRVTSVSSPTIAAPSSLERIREKVTAEPEPVPRRPQVSHPRSLSSPDTRRDRDWPSSERASRLKRILTRSSLP